MKLFAIIAAGLVATLGVAPAGAQVHHRERVTTVVTETRTVRNDRRPRYNRDRRPRYERDRRHPSYRSNGYRAHGARSHGYRTKRVCRNEWRNHHRQRVCRTIRARR